MGKPDEVSRAALIVAASRSDVALAFEGYEPGTAVVGRRGNSSWRLEVTGSQGHSSGIFRDELGAGAIFETSRILSAFYSQLREPYLTFNPSVVVGGTDVKYSPPTFTGTATGKTNVVARAVIRCNWCSSSKMSGALPAANRLPTSQPSVRPPQWILITRAQEH